MRLWHATKRKNFDSIMDNGLLPDFLGRVFFCEKPEHCIRFMRTNGVTGDILLLPVDFEEGEVEESFDHSKEFFKCNSYVFYGVVPAIRIAKCFENAFISRL